MSLPIITADQRLAEPRGIKGCIFGKSGIGKTSLLWTLDPARTLFIDDSLRILQAARQFGIGHLLGILAPDSQRPAQSLPGFAAIHHYTELLPDLQAAAGNA